MFFIAWDESYIIFGSDRSEGDIFWIKTYIIKKLGPQDLN